MMQRVFLNALSIPEDIQSDAYVHRTALRLFWETNPEEFALSACAETIRRSGEALLSIINDILDLSKSEEGMMELECQPFNLQRRIEATLDFVSVRASEKGLRLLCIIEDDVPSVIMGDPTRLGQILTNLLNNAVKFTERGDVTVSVSGRKQEDSTYEIHFEVKDTGIGVPEDKIERLFQPFSQVDASTTRKYGGTGLGLAISRRLVNLMGGRIWMESIVGIGSTFHFTILAESDPDALVDNSESFYVQMPEIDGLEATLAIRQRWKCGPKIIAMTVSALKGDREMCLKAGMDDYHSKPVSMEELARKLSRYRSSVDNPG